MSSLIPIREFLRFNESELHEYLKGKGFFVRYYNRATPLLNVVSQQHQPSIWLDHNDIGVEMCYPLREIRKIEKKNSTKIDLLYIPVTNKCPRIELCTHTDGVWITIGTIEFMMTHPFTVLGIYKGTGKSRERVGRIKDVE